MSIRNRRILLYFIPTLIILLFIYAYPVVNTLVSALFYDSSSGNYGFIGFRNFSLIAKNIGPTLATTFIWTVGSILPSIVLGLGTALLLNRDFRGKKLIMGCIVIPYSVPMVLVGVAWILMYQPYFGMLNVLLKEAGLTTTDVNFLSRENAMLAVIVARVWKALPFVFLNYYSSLRSIPDEYYEAADIDGAGTVQKLFRITIPQLRSVTMTLLSILTIWTFLVFDIIYAMTGGGPGTVTTIVSLQIYKEAYFYHDMGTASAWNLIVIFLLLALTIFYWKVFKRGEEE